MKDPITFVLNLLGYEKRKPSLLLMHMHDTTHGSWLQDLYRTNRLNNYSIKK
jgi:hypothetical protein